SGASASRRRPQASPAEPSSSVSDKASEAMVFGGVRLVAGDRALAEQILAQLDVELGVLTADPLQHHGGVFQLLLGVVQHDRLQLRVLDVVRTLAIPVDGFELLHQGGDRIVQVERLAAQLLTRDVEDFAGHRLSCSCAGPRTLTRPITTHEQRAWGQDRYRSAATFSPSLPTIR